MRLYLSWAKRYDTPEGENEPIGLILCGSKNEQVIELLLADNASTTEQRIKVSQYLLLDSEPALKERLAQLSVMWEQAQGDQGDGSTPTDSSPRASAEDEATAG